jgi:hypothetical protein
MNKICVFICVDQRYLREILIVFVAKLSSYHSDHDHGIIPLSRIDRCDGVSFEVVLPVALHYSGKEFPADLRRYKSPQICVDLLFT